MPPRSMAGHDVGGEVMPSDQAEEHRFGIVATRLVACIRPDVATSEAADDALVVWAPAAAAATGGGGAAAAGLAGTGAALIGFDSIQRRVDATPVSPALATAAAAAFATTATVAAACTNLNSSTSSAAYASYAASAISTASAITASRISRRQHPRPEEEDVSIEGQPHAYVALTSQSSPLVSGG